MADISFLLVPGATLILSAERGVVLELTTEAAQQAILHIARTYCDRTTPKEKATHRHESIMAALITHYLE